MSAHPLWTAVCARNSPVACAAPPLVDVCASALHPCARAHRRPCRKDDCARDFKIEGELGRGSFAVVKKAVLRKDNSQWALKCIDVSDCGGRGGAAPDVPTAVSDTRAGRHTTRSWHARAPSTGAPRFDWLTRPARPLQKSKLEREDEEALRTEVEILERMDHPNIVKLRAVYDTPKTFYMVLELMTGGELFDRIVSKSKYSEMEASKVVRCLADALSYCHKRGVVHRDLKPENLLYTDATDGAQIKIADFGLAKLLNQNKLMATACGTPGYVAPEILMGRPYTDKVDLWSLGVITYILLCGFPPFYDENNAGVPWLRVVHAPPPAPVPHPHPHTPASHQPTHLTRRAALFAQIKSGRYDFPSPYWDEIGEGAKDLLRRLLVVDPLARYGAEDVLKHPWVTGGARTVKLDSAYTQLRRFNARRRFRAGVKKVMAAQAFARFGKLRIGPGGGAATGLAGLAAAARAAGAAGAGGRGGPTSSSTDVEMS